MRIWDWRLLPYLPELQFKGQLRELVAIMRDWRDKGKTNHLLINKVMEYPKNDLLIYLAKYQAEYVERYHKRVNHRISVEFAQFAKDECGKFYQPFKKWHNKEYLRVCMANLYEKHFFGVGKSRITDEEWERLCKGYEKITGEKYAI